MCKFFFSIEIRITIQMNMFVVSNHLSHKRTVKEQIKRQKTYHSYTYRSISVQFLYVIHTNHNGPHTNHTRSPYESLTIPIRFTHSLHTNQTRFPFKSHTVPIRITHDPHSNHTLSPYKSYPISIDVHRLMYCYFMFADFRGEPWSIYLF